MAKMKTEEELAELEKLSATFVPEQKGDLVGSLISSQNLTEEYAKADPAYASKTQSLPSTYPEYRPIKGDGNCGFRAIAFGYFEALARWGNVDKFHQEAARLKSLNALLDATGQEALMYEDWVDESVDLLQKASSTSPEDVPNLLMETFNDGQKANAITQHFRMLTSAQLKLNADVYAPFVPDLDIEAYCKNHVDPFYEEIEHVGVKALVDSVINKAGIAVNYLYLDRSEGTEATPYSFPTFDHEGQEIADAPTVRLLYRPGHYDLLYTKDDLSKRPPDKVKAQSNSDTEVRMLHTIPQVALPEDINFDGLPGLDPLVQFHSAESEPLGCPRVGLSYNVYPPTVDVYEEQIDCPNHMIQMPYLRVEDNIEQDVTSTQASPGDIKIQSPHATPLMSVPPIRPFHASREQSPRQKRPEAPTKDADSTTDQNSSQLEEGQRLSWSPRTYRQLDYDNSASPNSRYLKPF